MRTDYSNRRALLNGGVSALQVVVISGVLLVSYRLAVGEVGTADFGLYSLYFAFGTLTQVGSLGFGVGAARHVATAWGEGRRSDLVPLVLVSVAIPAVGGVLVALLVWWALQLYAAASLSPAEQDLAAVLGPVVLAAACVAPVSTAAQGLMDGTSRAFVRGGVVVTASLVYLAVVVLLLPGQGVVALAWATLVQQAVVVTVLVGYLLVLARGTWDGGLTPSNLRAATRYNVKLHLVTVPTLAYEPVAKALLQAFAGVSAIAYYEIANRLLQQVSALVHAANQAVVPVVAVRASGGAMSAAQAFRKSFQAVFTLTFLGFGAALVVLPFVSVVVFEESSGVVLAFGAILVVGWVTNCLSGPAYFVGVTLDDFAANMVASYLVLAVVVVAGGGLGAALGGYGVAAGMSLALVAGSVLVNVRFAVRSGVRLAGLLPASQVGFGLATTAVSVAVLATSLGADSQHLVLLVGAGAAGLLLLGGLAVLRHPLRHDMRRSTA